MDNPLVAFLRARAAEEPDAPHTPGMLLVVNEYAEALRILDGFRETGWEEGRREALELACRAYASAHADCDGYRPEWVLDNSRA